MRYKQNYSPAQIRDFRKQDIDRLEKISHMRPWQFFIGQDGTCYPLSEEAIERAGQTAAHLKERWRI